MIFLPDVNIWVALTSNRHIHHSLATEWLQGVQADEIAFCRVSEMGLLRLLTNAHVMGTDVVTPSEAWRVYDEWRSDGRVIFLSERGSFDEEWRRMGNQISGGPNIWTDAYLAAFAVHATATVVTLDRAFPSVGGVVVRSLI